MIMNKSLIIPLLCFFLLIVLLWRSFSLEDPHFLPSQLIDKPFPKFNLEDLHSTSRMRHVDDLVGAVSLVNVWATWCANCLIEHPVLEEISQNGITIIGINYNDNLLKARAWLDRYGDPYAFHVQDKEGTLAIDLGVYGAPETFIIDASGTIRYRHVGVVTERVWSQKLSPIINLLDGGS
ncbi:MAG: DsbE family thiol:disulfide interchange protein [Gammaproteobacteria bacterium]|uniref:DsbE family thiol:disulfide interchange protein n=1 Tax=OM182 bacterium TaxID=2510334 RepID=A0A520S0P9_9GAMM|nr:DsbE family thiol:disulfide interchange protein [Gammaproteobacteria bacterium]OUV68049.1 MAG: thiol:disulfide interchange protein [Gammaproteobacteria bacterium TMED133]RZO76030.1 MAG: DsbE family thiol:disulfide interchange protein [OM182 bacterium]